MSPSVAEKLMEWERRREVGTPVTPEELCADSPDLVDEVRRRIRRLQECDRVLGFDETVTALGPAAPGEDIPKRIAEFEIRGRLGHGGMGDVYDAWDPALQRDVAIKVVRLPVDYWPFTRSRELTGRFTREGAALARLEHPYIVPVYQAGLWEDRPYIVMARVGGGSLADHLEDVSRLGPRAIAAFVEKVARAVHAAHEQGVLHRDLKPANILIDGKGDPRVGDFGLAKFWSPAESAEGTAATATERPTDLSVPGSTPGTPAYMSPEQFDSTIGKVGPATDVWALGIVLYELLTGERPFFGDTHQELGEKVCRAAAPSCRARRRDVPRWLDSVVTRCLAKAPADRYRSAAELAAALRVGLPRRRRWVWVASTTAMLLLVGTVGVIGMLSERRPSYHQVAHKLRFEERPEVVDAMERLANGQEVVLVDKDRRAPFDPLFGMETCRVVESDPAMLTLHSRWNGPGTAEFLPALPPGRYRVRAVVRHDSAYVHSKVGLYVGGRHWQSARGDHLGCVVLVFKDSGPDATNPPDGDLFASLQWRLNGQVEDRPEHERMLELAKLRYAPLPADQKRPFRTLELIVTETAVEGWWEGKRVGTVSLETAAQQQAKYLAEFPELRPAENDTHPFRGGVGLIVFNGTISVTDLRVTPRN
jgi:serine/threonine protein kinase